MLPRQTLLISLAALACVGCVWGQQTVSVDITQEKAHKNDNVTLTCRTTNAGSDPISIYKLITVVNIDGGVDDKWEEISSGDFLYPKYDDNDSGRFDIKKYEMSDTTTTIMLQITPVVEHDTGLYVCRILGTETLDSIRLEVYTPASHAAFHNGTEEIPDGETLELEEDEEIDLSCVTMGAVPKPHINITTGSNNYTHQFTERSKIVVHCENKADACPMHYSYNKSLHKANFKVKPADHGTKLVCNATVEHLPWSMASSLNLVVNFKPWYNCSAEHKAKLHERNAVIRCPVHFNPGPLQHINVTTYEGELVLSPNDKAEDIKFATEEVSSSRIDLVLTISQVTSKHFQDYTFSSSSQRGTEAFSIKLVKSGEDGDNVIDSASALSTSIVTLVTFILATFVLRH